jgi:ribonuclease D
MPFFRDIPDPAWKRFLKKHFGAELDKKYQKKDWSIRPLPEEMIAYAADDVRYLVDLYHARSKIAD